MALAERREDERAEHEADEVDGRGEDGLGALWGQGEGGAEGGEHVGGEGGAHGAVGAEDGAGEDYEGLFALGGADEYGGRGAGGGG